MEAAGCRIRMNQGVQKLQAKCYRVRTGLCCDVDRAVVCLRSLHLSTVVSYPTVSVFLGVTVPIKSCVDLEIIIGCFRLLFSRRTAHIGPV